ncbi:Antiviral helicase SKI2, partial [Bienertia sinuspersici]
TEHSLSQFPDVSSYCQQLKNLKDQLANVDQEITEQRLVLHLIAGLINNGYDTVAAMIQQTDPLPDFETARSKLLREEIRRANDQSALATTFLTQAPDSSTQSQSSHPLSQQQSGGGGGGSTRCGRTSRGGRGNNRGGRSNRGHGRGSYRNNTQQQQWNTSSQWAGPQNN